MSEHVIKPIAHIRTEFQLSQQHQRIIKCYLSRIFQHTVRTVYLIFQIGTLVFEHRFPALSFQFDDLPRDLIKILNNIILGQAQRSAV